MPSRDDPHGGQQVATAGTPLRSAGAAMIMVHGRGASAQNIIGLADRLDVPEFAYLAPQAAGSTWYPYSFLMPIERNEPHLSSALGLLGSLLQRVEAEGISAERTMLLGFSQGACLSLEFVARNPRRYGGIVGLSGGLIGPEGTPRDYPGDLDGTPVFIGSSDPDPHVPVARVRESERVLAEMGARATARIYPGMGHTINQDELEQARGMMKAVLSG